MSVLLRVDLLPSTERGLESRFSPNAPPVRVDSAARESEATGPAPSRMGILEAGSVVF